jgi:membrane fusion protein (multidrug efflux system)
VSIPRSALISRYGLTYVFVIKDGKALKKIVKVGRQDDISVEILQGLSEDDKVINSGALYLRDGDSAELISDTDHE